MIDINCHSSIRLESKNGIVIYIDPFRIKGNPKDANIILITHDHYDHYSLEDIEKVKNDDSQMFMLEPYEETNFEDINIISVPAFNDKKEYHPKEKNYVGYIITMDNEKYYITGDTDHELYFGFDIDYLFIPIGGTFTFDVESAAKYTNMLCPRFVIPTHFGEIVGSIDDGQKFERLIKDDISVLQKIKFE